MPTPIYVVAGQSNAGSLTYTGLYGDLAGEKGDYILLDLSVGGTSLRPRLDKVDWHPIPDGDQRTGELYLQLLDMVDTAIASHGDAYFAGLIWVQGEADTGTVTEPADYKLYLEALIDDLQSRYAGLEIAVVALGESNPTAPLRPNWASVRETQLGIAEGREGVFVLDPDPLVGLRPEGNAAYRDTIHYDSVTSDTLLRAALDLFTPPSAFINIAPIVGTELDDVIPAGQTGRATVYGQAGNDTITGGAFGDILSGGDGDDMLRGEGGDDKLEGGAGSDTLIGGAGNDTYYIRFAPDTLVEDVDGGHDSVVSAIDFTLPDNIEDLYAAPLVTRGLQLSGNALGNLIEGSDLADILRGFAGNDTLRGGGGDDLLLGGAGDDFLDGGGQNDIVIGGTGNDTYKLYAGSPKPTEDPGSGFDTLIARYNIDLSTDFPNFEAVTLLGTARAATGNDANNTLRGNDVGNRLIGNGGDDTIFGGGGRDYIDGGTGADNMFGGDDGDAYYVDNAGDRVREFAGGGTDVVYASVDFALPDHVEVLRLSGSAQAGIGNAEANRIFAGDLDTLMNGKGGNDVLLAGIGNDRLLGGDGNDILFAGEGDDALDGGAGADFLKGEAGADTLRGGDGKDRLSGGAGTDSLIGGAGDDVVQGGDDNDVLRGDEGDDLLVGGAGADRMFGGEGADAIYGGGSDDSLIGGAGADYLNGGGGNDSIYGGTGADLMAGGRGADLFVFDAGDFDGLAEGDFDKILDFSQDEQDVIRLNLIDAIDSGEGDETNDRFTFIEAAEFSGTAGELRYEQGDGFTLVKGDTDGDGAADLTIVIDGLFDLTVQDFAL